MAKYCKALLNIVLLILLTLSAHKQVSGQTVEITQQAGNYYPYQTLGEIAERYRIVLRNINNHVRSISLTVSSWDNEDYFTSSIMFSGYLQEYYQLPSHFIQQMFDELKTQASIPSKNRRLRPGTYVITVRLNYTVIQKSDENLLSELDINNSGSFQFIVPEYIRNIIITDFPSSYSQRNLNNVLQHMTVFFRSNVLTEYRLRVTSFTGPGGITCSFNPINYISFENENWRTALYLRRDNLAPLFENRNISCNCDCDPYEQLPPGNYNICMELLSSAGTIYVPRVTSCNSFTITQPEFTIEVNEPWVDICTVDELPQKLANQVVVRSDVPLSGYRVGARLYNASGFSCTFGNQLPLSGGTQRVLNLSDLRSIIDSDQMHCTNTPQKSPYNPCLANGNYTLQFILYPPNTQTPVVLSSDSQPLCTISSDNPEPSFEFNLDLVEDEVLNINQLIQPGNIISSIDINVPISNFKLKAEIKGPSGLTIRTATELTFSQTLQAPIRQISQPGIQQLLGITNTFVSGTDLTQEELYEGVLPPGIYSLSVQLSDDIGRLIPLVGAHNVNFTVRKVEPEFVIQTHISNENICNIADLYQTPNLQVEITSNIAYFDYRLSAEVKGAGFQCRTLAQMALEIEGRSGFPKLVSRYDIESMLGEGSTVFSAFLSPEDIYENCLSEGVYEVCFTLTNSSGQLVPWQSGSNPCHPFTVTKGDLLPPPFIVSPENGERFEFPTGFQNIVFAWEPVPFAPQSVTYTFRMVEITDTTRSPAMIMRSTPWNAFYVEELRPGVSFLHYGIDKPQLMEGHHYAFQIMASDPQNRVRFTNNGASEVHFIRFGPPAGDPIEGPTLAIVPGDTDFFVREVFPAPEIPEKVFFNRSVAGRYQYKFRHRDGIGNLANTRVQLRTVYAHFPNANSAEEIERLKGQLKHTQWADVSDRFLDGNRILDNSYTNATGDFKLFATIFSQDNAPDYGYHKNLKASDGTILPGIVLKAATITHSNRYFLADPKYVLLHEQDDDLISLTGLPKDFTVRFTLTTSGKLHNASSMFNNLFQPEPAGRPIHDYNIYLLRQYSPLGLPNQEGNKMDFEGQTKNGKQIVSKGTTDEGGNVFFSNLLLSQSNNDQYYIYIEPAEWVTSNYKFTEQPFFFNGNPLRENATINPQLIANSKSVYNHQYNPVIIQQKLSANTGLPEIYGRVTDAESPGRNTGIGGANINATVFDPSQLRQFVPGEIQLEPSFFLEYSGTRFTSNYPNGDYSIPLYQAMTHQDHAKGYQLRLVASKYGYGNHFHHETVEGPGLNRRKKVDFVLHPLGHITGKVKLKDKGGVAALVGIKDYQLQPAQPENPQRPNYNQPFVFSFLAPYGTTTVQADPPANLSASYFSAFKDVVVYSSGTTDAGTLELQPREHTVRITVARDGSNPIVPVPGAKVEVRFKENSVFTANSQGQVLYKFRAPDVSDFQLYVNGPDDQDWEPVLWTNNGSLSNIESPGEVNIVVRLKRAGRISGRVTYGQEGSFYPVDSATVSIDLGNGRSIRTYSDHNGEYVLRNVPMNRNVVVTAAKGRSQFVGNKRYAYLEGDIVTDFDFNLTIFNGMVITHLLRLPIEVHDLKVTERGAMIEGVFYDFSPIRANDWKLLNRDLMVRFITEIIPSGSEFNSDGIPLALPATGSILTNLTSLEWQYKDKVYYIQEPVDDIFRVENDEGWARISGKMRLVMMQYELNSAQINLGNNSIYIGNSNARKPEARLQYTVLGRRPTNAFQVMDQQGNDLNYYYYGFQSIATRASSIVNTDRSLVLDTRLQTNLDNVPQRQKNLNVNIGKITIYEDRLEDVKGNRAFEFMLNNWNLQAFRWTLGEGGIRVDSCLIRTGWGNYPVNDLYITYTRIGAGMPHIAIDDLILAESVPVKVEGVKYLEYNQVKQLWSIDVRPDRNSTGPSHLASAGRIYNVNAFSPDDDIRFQNLGLFANNTIEGSVVASQSVNVYNIARFAIKNISITRNQVTLNGALAIDIPGLGMTDNTLILTKGSRRRNHNNQNIYEASARINPVRAIFDANAVRVELLAQGQKFEPGLFESAVAVRPNGTAEMFNARLTRKDNTLDLVLSQGQKFAFSQGKNLSQIQGKVSSFVNPLNNIKLSSDDLIKLQQYSNGATALHQHLESLGLESSHIDELSSLAISNPAGFKSAISGIRGITVTKQTQLEGYGQSYASYAGMINNIPMDPSSKEYLIKNAGKMGAINQNTWGDFNIKGQLEGANGASGELSFIVDNEWVAKDQQIGVKNVPSSFGGIGLLYNIELKRLEGHVSFEQQFASALVRGDASAVIGATGWYFMAMGQFLLNDLKLEGVAGIMFGHHPMEDEMNRMFENVSFYYRELREMPKNYPSHLDGFYFNAGAELPVPYPGTFKTNFVVAKVEYIITIGGDSRMGMTFANDGTTLSIGQGIFVKAYVKAAVGFIACAEISLRAAVGMDVSGEYNTNGTWWAEGVGYVTVAGTVKVGAGLCLGDCSGLLCGSQSVSGSITAIATATIGSQEKSISVRLQ